MVDSVLQDFGKSWAQAGYGVSVSVRTSCESQHRLATRYRLFNKILNKAGQLTYEKFKKRAVNLYSELETLQDFYQKARLESQLTKRTEGDFRDFLVEALISSEEDLRQVAQEYHELYPQRRRTVTQELQLERAKWEEHTRHLLAKSTKDLEQQSDVLVGSSMCPSGVFLVGAESDRR